MITGIFILLYHSNINIQKGLDKALKKGLPEDILDRNSHFIFAIIL